MTAHRCAVFCKSFDEDFERLALLVASHARLCPDMPFLLSIPRAQNAALRKTVALHDAVTVVFDEDYSDAERVSPFGWIQQQVCKLSVHRTGFADAYLSVDSDSFMVAPVTPDDFFDGDRMRIVYSGLFTKYTPGNAALLLYLTDPSSDLMPAPRPGSLIGFGGRLNAYRRWMAANEVGLMERASRIKQLFRVPEETAMQPGQVLHARLLQSMELYLGTHGLDVGGMLSLACWEYNWYGAFASVSAPQHVSCGVSPIVHFASAEDVAHAKAHGVTEAVLARRFKIVTMAARHFESHVF